MNIVVLNIILKYHTSFISWPSVRAMNKMAAHIIHDKNCSYNDMTILQTEKCSAHAQEFLESLLERKLECISLCEKCSVGIKQDDYDVYEHCKKNNCCQLVWYQSMFNDSVLVFSPIKDDFLKLGYESNYNCCFKKCSLGSFVIVPGTITRQQLMKLFFNTL